MIVLDASALVELLLATAIGRAVADEISDPKEGLHVPHLADLEVAQALRRLARQRAISARTASHALTNLLALDLERHSHEPLLGRIWELRDRLTVYDAAYVALAEALPAALLTCDAAVARAARRAVLLRPKA